LGFKVEGLGFKVEGLLFKLDGLGFRWDGEVYGKTAATRLHRVALRRRRQLRREGEGGGTTVYR
jgi:hypothetical protein